MLLDVFERDAFTLASLTSQINDLPFVPTRIQSMQLFEEGGINTTKANIEAREGVLRLVPTQPRGAPSTPHLTGGRTLRQLSTLHLPMRTTIYAATLQDARRFGTEAELETAQTVLAERMTEMRTSMDVTIEWQRLGALKGRVLDADGSELIDLFEFFNVSQPTEIDFDLDAASPAPGAVRGKCSAVIRAMEDELGALPLGGVHSFVGPAFFDALVDHPETREAYQRWNNGEALRERTARRTFFYAGITFEEYRGRVGTIQFVDNDKAHFFPVATPGVFKTVFAPGNFIDTVNAIGLPYYARVVPDQAGRWVQVYAESNPLSYCTRPRTLIQGRRT
ncbi:major capsid protein [Luteimonas aestuarii]|nr:major capsid protein [Luteimonas aestuarii]